MKIEPHTLADRLRGRFIVFDGPDGGGKTTQRRMVAEYLGEASADLVVCRDPGGTKIGDRIRSVLLDHDLTHMAPACETMLFMASRAQLVAEVIDPALDAGKTVLCDRYVTATCAYQGALGYDAARIIELARYAVGDTWPDLTLILDVDVETGFARIGRKPGKSGKNFEKASGEPALFGGAVTDAMEARSIEFHRAVRRLFQEAHTHYPGPVVTIDAAGRKDEVHERVLECLARVTD